MKRVLLILLAGLTTLIAVPSAEAQGGWEPPWADGRSRPEDLRISLVTFGPGDTVHQYFGHTALEVRDRRLGAAALYNFGMFGFGQDFLMKFLRGRLEFWVGVQDPARSYQLYVSQDRDVRLLELDLPPRERLALARDLHHVSLPENRTYLYHHYFDNCATRIVDAIDRAVDGAFKAHLDATPARMSFREHTRRYAARDPLVDWALVFLMNDSMEKDITRRHELFLPFELEEAVRSFQIPTPGGGSKPLATHERVLHDGADGKMPPEEPPTTWPFTLLLGLGLGGLFFGLAFWFRRTRAKAVRIGLGLLEVAVGLTFGLLGLLLFLLGTLTEHEVTFWNENLLFANPVTFALVVLGIGVAAGRRWAWKGTAWAFVALAATSLLGLVLKVLPAFDQENLLVWTLLVPLNLGGGLAFWALRHGSSQVADAAPASAKSEPGKSAPARAKKAQKPGHRRHRRRR